MKASGRSADLVETRWVARPAGGPRVVRRLIPLYLSELGPPSEAVRRRGKRHALIFHRCYRLCSLWRSARLSAGETPKRGGTLTFIIPAEAPPSLDGHREGTFATVHMVAPFYSVLMRVDPQNPSDTTRFDCDLCTAIPTATDDGKTYTFNIREGVKFQDDSSLTADDVAASWRHIIFPPPGVLSARQNYFSMVDSVEAPNATTVVFRLKFATGAFLPALADPFAFIYEKRLLDADPHWYETHIMGSGPFRPGVYTIGQSMTGLRNPNFYRAGQPYLDGFEALLAPKEAVRVAAIQG